MSVARTATRPIVVPGGSGNPSGIVPFFTLAPLGGLATRLPPGELASGRPLSAPPAVLMVGVFGASVAVWSLPQPVSAMPAVTSRAARAAERGVITRSFGGSGQGCWSVEPDGRGGSGAGCGRRVQVEYRVRHDGTGVESLIEGDRRPLHSGDGLVARTGARRPASGLGRGLGRWSRPGGLGPATWPGDLARRPGPATWPGDLARRPGPATWPGDLARRPGPATWPGDLARRPGPATWPGGLGRRARPLG